MRAEMTAGSMRKIRILLLEGNRILREGIAVMLNREADFLRTIRSVVRGTNVLPA
jgi:hypothetical protein